MKSVIQATVGWDEWDVCDLCDLWDQCDSRNCRVAFAIPPSPYRRHTLTFFSLGSYLKI
jgi:hypothetical protein